MDAEKGKNAGVMSAGVMSAWVMSAGSYTNPVNLVKKVQIYM